MSAISYKPPAGVSQIDILTSYRAYPVGASIATRGDVGTSAFTFLAPASNTQGAVLRSAALYGNGQTVQLYTGTAAPSSVNDGLRQMVLQSANAVPVHLPFPLYLPPGYGIFAIASGASQSAALTFDIL